VWPFAQWSVLISILDLLMGIYLEKHDKSL